jgi:hypothetical protein
LSLASQVERVVVWPWPDQRQRHFVQNEFLVGYEVQREWAWLITCAFFCGGVGAGTFVVSFFDKFEVGMIAGLLIVGVLKTTAHVLFLGHPLRAWRAVRGWRTSWISRGVMGPNGKHRADGLDALRTITSAGCSNPRLQN